MYVHIFQGGVRFLKVERQLNHREARDLGPWDQVHLLWWWHWSELEACANLPWNWGLRLSAVTQGLIERENAVVTQALG